MLEKGGDARSLARRRAGQFAMIRRKRRFGWSEPHPFTISNAPSADDLRFTIKRSGRFSSSIATFAHGEPVLCEGPYGVFTLDEQRNAHHLFLAGGVGITPFLSMLRDAADRQLEDRFTLVWGNKTRADIVAEAELSALTEQLALTIVHVLDREPVYEESSPTDGVRYRGGRVSADLLALEVADQPTAYYVCGPKGMARATIGAIQKAFGVRRSRIRREAFFW
jgi:ferredoxin-NADP reductase